VDDQCPTKNAKKRLKSGGGGPNLTGTARNEVGQCRNEKNPREIPRGRLQNDDLRVRGHAKVVLRSGILHRDRAQCSSNSLHWEISECAHIFTYLPPGIPQSHCQAIANTGRVSSGDEHFKALSKVK
jgi:hypothetical protein